MRVDLRPLLIVFSCASLAVPTAHAQVMEGSVRIEYAEVLRVEPVHLPTPLPDDEAAECAAMRPLEPAQISNTASSPAETDCIPLQSARAQAGPLILYDVDYVLRGIKYRSRLPYDPGNRLQVQLSVTPVLPPEEPPPAPDEGNR